MHFLKKIGIDTYMILLIVMVCAGIFLPVDGEAAHVFRYFTYFAISLLFFLYGARLDPKAVKAGITNWRLQGLALLITYAMFPVIGFGLSILFGPLLGVTVVLGLLFLSVLPSTIQSSIAFTSMAGGNVSGAICAASLSNILGVVITPLLVTLILQQDGGGVRFDAVIKIGTQILMPFVLGQFARPWIGAFVQRHKLMTMVVDRGSILLIVYSAFSAGTISGLWDEVPLINLFSLFFVVSLYLAISMVLTRAVGLFAKLPYEDRAALFYCGSTKSLASGLPIASALFTADKVGAIVLPLMIYHMIQLFVCAYIAQRAGSSKY